jgi:hypothetical protein
MLIVYEQKQLSIYKVPNNQNQYNNWQYNVRPNSCN